MTESKLLCVRVATLLRNKYASTKSDVIKQSMLSEFPDFFFIVIDIYLGLITGQAKKHRHCLAITLVRTG